MMKIIKFLFNKEYIYFNKKLFKNLNLLTICIHDKNSSNKKF